VLASISTVGDKDAVGLRGQGDGWVEFDFHILYRRVSRIEGRAAWEKVLVSRNHVPVIKSTARTKSFNPISAENCIIYND
jgi:hypothetical protein